MLTAKKIKLDNQLAKIKLFEKINPELSNVYGHLISDGGIYPEHSRIAYFNTKQELLDDFTQNFVKCFGIKPDIIKNDKISILNIGSKKLSQFFENFNIDLIFKGSAESKCSFLRACFDDEGSISKQGIISIVQKDKRYIENIQKLLKSIKIKRTIIYTIRNKKLNKDYWALRIYVDQNRLFNKKIGFIHPIKKQRLIDYLKHKEKRITPDGKFIKKILAHGRKAYCISLPVEWVRKHNLKAGDNLIFEIDNKIVIKPDKN